MKTASQANISTDIIPAQQMSKIGMELLMKAALCAATVALFAGVLAALVGA